jgi:hypothetical protein
MSAGVMTSPDLEKTLEQLSKALEKTGREGGKALFSAARAFTDGVREAAERDRRSRREKRRQERRERKLEKRLAAMERASFPRAFLNFAIAAVLGLFAAWNSQNWWLVFVAIPYALAGARQLSLAMEKRRLLAPAAPVRDGAHEIDVLCDQLLADLKASPDAVRNFVQRPERTIEALRTAAKAVDQRRRALSGGDAQHQLAALEQQRLELRRKRDAAGDLSARDKFDAALRSLDGQEAALRQLTAASERLDGEYTSLLVLLQEMRTRVAVARSTDQNQVQLDGLRQNVQQLNAELQAITESLHFTAIDAPASDDVGARVAAPVRERG